jgi:hypothetical protein
VTSEPVPEVVGIATIIACDPKGGSTFLTCKIPQSYRKTTRLKISLGRNAEPEHILAPICYGFDIEQVMKSHVDRNGIIAPATTTEVDSHHHPIDILGDAIGDRLDRETSEHRIWGVARLSKLHGTNQAEFAPLVSDSYHPRGLGTELFRRMQQIGQEEKLQAIVGYILTSNYSNGFSD